MLITSIIQGVACLYVFYVSIMALNRMSKSTAHLVRYSYIALAGGAAAGVVSCVTMRDIFECVFAVGIALYMAGNKRGCTP